MVRINNVLLLNIRGEVAKTNQELVIFTLELSIVH